MAEQKFYPWFLSDMNTNQIHGVRLRVAESTNDAIKNALANKGAALMHVTITDAGATVESVEVKLPD